MRKFTTWVMVGIFVACASAAAAADATNFANDAYASQLSMDAFNKSVKHRMQVARFGFYGGVNAPPAQRYAASSMYGDCPTSSFTVWADGYASWAKKKDNNGYRYAVAGPALGFDWSNGPLTVGLATTYNWGKLKGREVSHDNKTRTFGVTAYAQYNYERFYVNAAVSYGRNRFKSNRYEVDGAFGDTGRAKYHSNTWNAQMEVGTRLNICNFLIEPNVGLRYFHDRRNSFDETFDVAATNLYGKRTYHTWEVPVGVDVAYEIGLFNAMLMPRLHFAWVPQFDRKHPTASRTVATALSERSRRTSHGWELGAGFQTKVFRGMSAHVDYTVNMRSKTYEHTLTAGLGMSF